ncbi:hypothetical protein K1T71_004621 [Dendrolimus kikuchii]|uniref:Uncharacterized protein n=1 Tax=Dendrolimus kikuchii TaxID=765133 RepID=A0ACC1D830_9NEOP|nr:hypothetical protein K1T71_004621 [Dendrolimus kikuchii]
MSRRKEDLKKTLGITEYPWSSDDEDILNQESAASSEVRLSSIPQQSVAETPETSSGLITNESDPPLNQPRDPPVTRRERETFWAVLRDRQSRIPRYRRYEEPSSNETTSEVRPRDSAAIGRILAFRKFTHNLYSQPTTSTSTPSVNTPSGSAGPSRSPLFTPTAADMSGSIHSGSPAVLLRIKSQLRQGRNAIPAARGSASECPLPRVLRKRPRTRASTRANPAPTTATSQPNTQNIPLNNMNYGINEDIIELDSPIAVSPTSNTTPSTDNRATLLSEQLPLDNDEPREAPIAAASMSVMSLEEEILEIDVADETNANTDADMAAAGTAQDDNNQAEPTLPNENEPTLAQGVKRKRESGGSNVDPQTVKEFNQVLLQLLECPVCLDWMEPPMSQCRRGHLVCAACRERLTVCPVCRTIFSSVRNRAMEGVADILRYPCRHGCGREVRLRKRTSHEASCDARLYQCPMPACAAHVAVAYAGLAMHFQKNHAAMLKFGNKHILSLKVNVNMHNNWVVMAMDEFFLLRIDVDIRTWGIVVYIAYIGPKKKASDFVYQISIYGEHNSRKLVYTRATHSDLESILLSVSRQDCFHLTLDQALNFLRFKNKNCETDKYLDLNLEIKKCEKPINVTTKRDESDS